MKIKLPNQTDGVIRIVDFNGEHVFPVAGDGTVDVPDEGLAQHVLASVNDAVAVEAGDESFDQGGDVGDAQTAVVHAGEVAIPPELDPTHNHDED